MNEITIQQLLPAVFAGRTDINNSSVWLCDYTFSRGSLYLIEAESGRGKSSLCSFLYGERRDYSGSITFDHADILNYTDDQWDQLRRSSISTLFQDLRLFPELTAFENVQIKNQQTGFKSANEILQWFDRLEIADKCHVPVRILSLGQQQRVALIRALCQPFDFLLLDEPVSHLDARIGRVASEIIYEESQQRQAAVIATSVGVSLPLPYHQTLLL